MTPVFEGKQIGTGLRIAVVVSRFNDLITERLLQGALGSLKSHDVPEDNTKVVWVPGAFELPLVANKLAMSGQFDAVITLGCVIRGKTSHYEHVCAEAAKGVARAAEKSGIPVIFGVLTTDTVEQAMARAGGKAGNKGVDAAMAAIEMANLLKTLYQENLCLA